MRRNQRVTEASFVSIRAACRLAALLSGLLVCLPPTATAGQVSFALVSARDHVEGSMTTAQSVYADETRIYLATAQGTLFVLARDRAANFPVVESIPHTSPLLAVRGDSQNLYLAAGDGNLRVYRKGPQLALVQTLSLATYSLSGLAVTDDRLFVAVGQTSVAVNDRFVYLAGLNDGDFVIELSKPSLTPVRTYGTTVEPNIVAFDRQTGNRAGAITSPGGPNLYANDTFVMGTVPGCCGSGIAVHDANNFALAQYIWRSWTNTVVQRDNVLIAGNEAGNVDLFDLASNPSQQLATQNLPQLTGHIWPEDIEIRALWADHVDNLIFAGSSWGNDQTRGPSLPSFFVLESTAAEPAVTFSSTVLSFGSQSLGTTSAGQSVTLTNTGTAPLTIGGLSSNTEFPVLSSDCPESVPVGGGCTFSIGFAPSAPGVRAGSIAVHDDARDSPQTIQASGTGIGVINVTQPDTALAWAIGTVQQIKWTHNLSLNSWVSVEISRDGGATWTSIAAAVQNATASTGVVTWTVTPPATTQGRVRVSALDGPISDISDVGFAIVPPVMTVTQPNTNVRWVIGSTQTIRWTHNLGLNTPVEIALSRNGGATWETLASSVPTSGGTSGAYKWVVAGAPTTQGRIRVRWLTGPGAPVSDVSDVNFRIARPITTF